VRIKEDARKIPFSLQDTKPEDLYHLAEIRKTQFGKESEPLSPGAVH
jgi:hypothetical protein